MRTSASVIACAFALSSLALADEAKPQAPQQPTVAQLQAAQGDPVDPVEHDKKMQWWRDAHFGMFIHYGLYSGLECTWQGQDGRGEWTQRNIDIDTDTYAKAALPLFRPAPGCAEEWVKLAQEAGCKYMVLTSKHHEGFCLFDAKNSDYTAGKLLGRDIVKEFTDACHAAGMRVGYYHSVIDWHHPAYDNTIRPAHAYPSNQAKMLKEKGIPRDQKAYIKYLHEQAEQLVTAYGKVDILWWDFSTDTMSGDRAWEATKLMAMCREKQPGIIMNNRLWDYQGCPTLTSKADFTTPEQFVPARDKIPAYDWESCMTVGNHWGYSVFEQYKSPVVVINALESCVARGGNLLLNIGPKPDGSVPEQVRHVFQRIGAWMKVNSEAIYESRAVLDPALPESLRIVKIPNGNKYIFLPVHKELVDYTLEIPRSLGQKPAILGQPDLAVDCKEENGKMVITIPATAWIQAVEGLPVLRLLPRKD